MQKSHVQVDQDIQQRLHELRSMIRRAAHLTPGEQLPLYDLVDLGLAVCEGLTQGCVAVNTVELLVEELQDILNQCDRIEEPQDAVPRWVNAA